MFYELFFSTTDDCRRERTWMLRLLVNGLKTEEVGESSKHKTTLLMMSNQGLCPVQKAPCI